MFATLIEANYISKKEDFFASFRMTEDDEREIRRLAKDERIGEKVYILSTESTNSYSLLYYIFHNNPFLINNCRLSNQLHPLSMAMRTSKQRLHYLCLEGNPKTLGRNIVSEVISIY